MKMLPFPCILLAGLFLAVVPEALAAPACVAQSTARRNVLLELYTSEGCNSCPPADSRLSQFKGRAEYAGQLVPLAFHVDYWDSLGWVDRFASPGHTRRQQEMARRAGSLMVYTPQFFRNGRDWRSSASPLDGIGTTATRIVLELGTHTAGQLLLDAGISEVPAEADVWLAVYEHNLQSQVRAGENVGKVLRHDYVVRRLIGPLSPDRRGHLSLRRQIPLEADWKRADLGIVAFVQDRKSGEVLQALQRHACAG
jgi:hypothetical protein